VAQKNVIFDHCEVWAQEKIPGESNEYEETKLNIASLFEKIIKYEQIQKETVRSYRGGKARIQSITKNKNGLYEIQFLRLRIDLPPGIANDDGEYEIIKLEDNEYIGVFTAAMYDAEKSIFVFHRNNQAFNANGLSGYLTSLLKDPNTTIVLKPIISGRDLEKIMKAKHYRAFEISLDSNSFCDIDNHNSLIQIVSLANKFKSNTIKLSFSVGKAGKNESLDNATVRDVISESVPYLDDFNRYVIRYRDCEDTQVETMDLLEERKHDGHTFNYDRSNPITYDKVINKLVEKYLAGKKT